MSSKPLDTGSEYVQSVDEATAHQGSDTRADSVLETEACAEDYTSIPEDDGIVKENGKAQSSPAGSKPTDIQGPLSKTDIESVQEVKEEAGSVPGGYRIPTPPPPPPLPPVLKSPGIKLATRRPEERLLVPLDQPSTSGEVPLTREQRRQAEFYARIQDYMENRPELLNDDFLNMLSLDDLNDEYLSVADQVDLLVQQFADDFLGDEFLPSGMRQPNVEAWSMYSHGPEIVAYCEVCFDNKKLHRRRCCQLSACDDCLKNYLEVQICEGVLQIPCMNCTTLIFRDEILVRVSVAIKEKYYKFLVDANKDPKVKTCPNCSHIYTLKDEEKEQRTKYGLLVVCPEKDCQMSWCFDCHAPFHQGIKCKDFSKGDKLVAKWAKEKHYGNNNAQKCPRCKIYIERKGGCDHMICSKCSQSFCYRCGGRYIDLKFFGNHLSRYSPLGCKYNFKPNQPFIRRAVRGSVLGAKIFGGIFLVGFGIAAVGFLVGTSVIILPAFGGYKYYKHRKLKRQIKRQQELMKARSKNAMLELHRERLDEDLFDRYIFLTPYGTSSAERHPPPPLIPRGREMQVRSTPELARRSDSVHIGIQTGNSQQVDVTVHNPYHNHGNSSHGNGNHGDSPLQSEQETLNSEIRMNISDERGQVTVTTAEISHNTTSGDGSEAEIVLHVKTSYPKSDKEAKSVDAGKEMKAVSRTSGSISSSDSSESQVMSDADIKTEGKDDSKIALKLGNSRSLETKGKCSVFHRRAHSTGSLKKPARKQDFGSLSVKNKKSLQRDLLDAQLDPNSTFPVSDLGHFDGWHNQSGSKPPGDDDQSESEALSQSGCFMKIFGKKFQNQPDKDKLATLKGSDIIPGDCPDVVSCALEAELKRKDSNSGGEQELDITKEFEQDKFIGLISQESHTTSL